MGPWDVITYLCPNSSVCLDTRVYRNLMQYRFAYLCMWKWPWSFCKSFYSG